MDTDLDTGLDTDPCLDKDLDTAITNLPHPTVEKIAEKFSENRTTVERQMHALGFVTKLDQWI